MYELEIETKNKLKKIKNPRKVRIKDMIFFDLLQVMDGDGIWHTICVCSVGVACGQFIVNRINHIIERRQPSVYVDI